MIEPNLQAKLSLSIRTIAHVPAGVAIGAESRLVEDLGIDSLGLVDVMLEIQEAYGVSIDEDDVSQLRTMADLFHYVDLRRSEAAAA